jgi:hypothetical protein
MTTQTPDLVGAPRTITEQVQAIFLQGAIPLPAEDAPVFDNPLAVFQSQPSPNEADTPKPEITELYQLWRYSVLTPDEALECFYPVAARMASELGVSLDAELHALGRRLRRDIPENTGQKCKNDQCRNLTISNPAGYNKDRLRWFRKQLRKACTKKPSFDHALYCPACQGFSAAKAASSNWAINRDSLTANCKRNGDKAAQDIAQFHSTLRSESANKKRTSTIESKRHWRMVDARDVRGRNEIVYVREGGLFTSVHRLYSPQSLLNLRDGGRRHASAQTVALMEANLPLSLHLPFPEKDRKNKGFRTENEASFHDWVIDQNLFDQVLYPELDDPQRSNVPSLTPYGLENGFVQDFRLHYQGQKLIVQWESLARIRWMLLSALHSKPNMRSGKQKERELFRKAGNELSQLALHARLCSYMTQYLTPEQRGWDKVLFLDTRLVAELLPQQFQDRSELLGFLEDFDDYTVQQQVLGMLDHVLEDTAEVLEAADDLFRLYMQDSDLALEVTNPRTVVQLFQHCWSLACKDQNYHQDRYLQKLFRRLEADQLCLPEEIHWRPKPRKPH